MDKPSIIRTTITAEFPRAEDVQAYRFTLTSKLTGSPEGIAVVCFDARYASLRWQGADRITRMHATPAVWMTMKTELQALVIGAVAPVGLESLIAHDRSLSVVCSSIHVIHAEPFALPAKIDELLA